MGNPRIRGLVFLAVAIVFAWLFCVFLPFQFLPGAGRAIALPIIAVPGEIVHFPNGFEITNSFIGTLITDVLLLLFVGLAWRASKGWTQEVPGKFQAWVEFIIGAVYDFVANIGGTKLRSTPLLWPLVGTLFLFLLTANWMKLLPGVESVGFMHCAYEGTYGYARVQGATENSFRLYVDRPLYAGEAATEETYYACNNFLARGGDLQHGLAAPGESDADHSETGNTGEGPDGENVAPESAEQAAGDGGETLNESDATAVNEAEDAGEAAAEAPAAEGESAPTEGARNASGYVLTAAEPPAEEAEEEESIQPELTQEDQDAQLVAYAAQRYSDASVPVSQAAIDSGIVHPYVFHITPFVRGPATDLSLTFALAILVVVIVQVYGVWSQGPVYFEKFVNIKSVGEVQKRPLGVIDFVVGLFEIISEIGKIVSLSFRLFGNLFAGTVLLSVMIFLLAYFIPGVFIGLELIIGLVQALVFGVLLVVYAVQAQEAHHGDHDGHDDGHGVDEIHAAH